MGNRRVGSCRREPLRSAALQALSDAAATGKGFRRDFRTGRAQAGLARVPCADGDFVAGAPWTQRLRQLRILSRIWLRSGREIEFAGRSDPDGRENRALRNPAEFLRASHRARREREGYWRGLL